MRVISRDIFLLPRNQAEDVGGNRPVVWAARVRGNARWAGADGEGRGGLGDECREHGDPLDTAWKLAVSCQLNRT